MATATTATPTDAGMRLDPSVIDGLSGIMPATALKALLSDLVRDASMRLQRLSEVHVARGSLDLIARDAHDLKSLGGNFGLMGLSDLAGTVERAARSTDIESVRAVMPKLIRLGQSSIRTLAINHQLSSERAS